MEQVYKHFSHSHNLILHQLPEGIQVSCSGCNSSGTGTVYVCWQCNFFLHEQCYRATRSLKHPSHPPHPLTLVPYPTYPSNSFYCNSCESVGTGLSYSCADCEFDLHVQCAYSISRATSFHGTHQYQELVPSAWNGAQNPNMAPNFPFVSVPDRVPTPFTCAQDPYLQPNPVSNAHHHNTSHDLPYDSIPPSSQNSTFTAQDPPIVHNLASVSIPPSSQNPFPTVQGPPMAPPVSIPVSSQNPIASPLYPSIAQDPPMVHNLASVSNPTSSQNPSPIVQGPPTAPSVSVPMGSQNPIASAPYLSMAQTGPSLYIPTNPSNASTSMRQQGPSDSIPTESHNPMASTKFPSMDQSEPSVSIPTIYPSKSEDPSKPQNVPSVSVSTSFQNPIGTEPSSNNPPNYPPNPIPCSQDPSMPQSAPSFSIHTSSHKPVANTQNPSIAKTGPSVSIPSNQSNTTSSSQDPPIPQSGFQDKGTMHFSHPHTLSVVDLQEDEENEVTCSVCEGTLIGKGYSCVKRKCDFHLHESCFHLEKEIHHKSHPEHPLILLPVAPYNNKNDEFTCNACFSDGTGFTYHCSVCQFDLHIQCVSLPETVRRDDHDHELKLYYSCPVEDEEYRFYCDVCHGEVEKDRWVYYCDSCEYGTHLGCVDCEECEEDSTLDPQAQLRIAQFQLELARQRAQLLAGFGASLSSLVG